MLLFPCEKSKFLSCPSVIGKLCALRHTPWCLRQNQSNNGVVPTGLEPAARGEQTASVCPRTLKP